MRGMPDPAAVVVAILVVGLVYALLSALVADWLAELRKHID
jgi:hypothetical protein